MEFLQTVDKTVSDRHDPAPFSTYSDSKIHQFASLCLYLPE